MIIRIKGNDVILEDEKLTTLFLTTGQLLELVKVINVSTREDGTFSFDSLEFTV